MVMQTILGRTGLSVNKDGFGALPIQRVSFAESAVILRRALDGGINFIDTARGYTDSEEKIAAAISDRRQEYYLASKTPSGDAEGFWKDLETSLANLKTDHIDLYQFHNPAKMPRPGDGTGLYEAMLRAREKGMIRFIGITNHRLPVAREAVESGLYDTLQFPLSYLSGERDIELVELCAVNRLGFIAMKALAGGLITDIAAARASLAVYSGVVPIWGIQRESELDALFTAMAGPAELTEAQRRRIEADRKDLTGAFCRGCGYCLPCPENIVLNWCVRMPQALRRMPATELFSEHWQQEMAKIENCRRCGLCKSRCPYGLDIPVLLQKNYADYRDQLARRN
ncbi:MAG: aldo/keto reductase [Treponema sp.]|jgi:predicted aldo/keto reductase-like oxidoreductase|nr:aldo/keto reductase [Treponema sp.]